MLSVLLLGVGNAIVWWPLWNHWHLAVPQVEPAVVAAHRQLPNDPALATVAETAMMTDHPLRGEAAVEAAEKLLRGELALPQFPVLRIDPGFAPRDLEQGAPVQQLFMASLVVPDLLLRAHEHRPHLPFVAAARRYLLAFVAHEAQLQFSEGFERNAHAVANRAAVLARYWRHTRDARAAGFDAAADAASAAAVHLHAQRLAGYLSRPSHFIAGTNHGVMQNIALLQLATAFPSMPGAASWRALAMQRLEKQRPWYIAPDGAVLEHAAGYHFHGVVLSGYIVRLAQAAGMPAPTAWAQAHERALSFMALLQRPDRSLPPFGNTYRYRWALPPVLGVSTEDWEARLRQRPAFTQVFPVSGHALWWSPRSAAGAATHTHVPWGRFAGHGHRRDQDLSLLVWAEGTDWSTNTGYWPGSDPAGFNRVAGWDGGNAPHLLGEPSDGPRSTMLLAHADGAVSAGAAGSGTAHSLRFIDLERTLEGHAQLATPSVRRQILQWQGSTWLVLDTYVDPAQRPLRVIWTAAPEVAQRQTGPLQFVLERDAWSLGLTVAGSDGVSTTPLRGSREPFGGWVAFNRQAHPAPSVDARLPSPGGWMLTTLDLADAATARAAGHRQATMVRFADPADWEVRLRGPADGGDVHVRRRAGVIELRTTGAAQPLALHTGTPVPAAHAQMQAARAELLAEYPRFRTLEPQRRRYSLALVGLWLLASGAVVAGWLWLGRRGRLRSS